MRDAMRERARLAGAGASDDEKRSSSLPFALPTPCSTACRCFVFSRSRWEMRMGGEASGQGRQVKQILVLFEICGRPVLRSEGLSSRFPLLRQNQLAQNRLVGACGASGQPAVPPPDGTLLACYVLPGMSPAAAAVALLR
jgi:hypothetical protein